MVWAGIFEEFQVEHERSIVFLHNLEKQKKKILNYDPCLPVCFCMVFLLNDVNFATKLYVIKKSTLFGNLDSDKNIVYLQC